MYMYIYIFVFFIYLGIIITFQCTYNVDCLIKEEFGLIRCKCDKVVTMPTSVMCVYMCMMCMFV